MPHIDPYGREIVTHDPNTPTALDNTRPEEDSAYIVDLVEGLPGAFEGGRG